MSKRKLPVLAEFAGWVTEEMPAAAEYAYFTGLYDLADEYPALIEARARQRATALIGGPRGDLELLKQRESLVAQKLDSVRAGRASQDRWGKAIADLQAGLGPVSFWRAAPTILLLTALIGVAGDRFSVRGLAILTLSAVLVLLNLRLVPATVRFIAQAGAALGSALRRQWSAAVLAFEGRRLRRKRLREEDRQGRADELVQAALAVLLAEYRHHKNLAVRVAAA